MLQNLRIRDFKSIRESFLSFGPETPLVVIAGANSSGKSNLLEALRFLSGLSHGWTVAEAAGGKVEGGVRIWNGIRGGLRGAIRSSASSMVISSDWMCLGDGYAHEIEICADGTIARESLANIFTAVRDPSLEEGKQLVVEFLPGNHRASTQRLPENQTVLSTGRPYSAFVDTLRITLAGIKFLEPRPEEMRRFVDLPSLNTRAELSSDASNLSAVLWSLCCRRDGHDGRGMHHEFTEWLSELGETDVEGLEFEETDDGQVIFKVREKGGQLTSARSLSDGTLVFLAYLCAVRTMISGQTLILEDFEHGLHPARQRLLLDAMVPELRQKGSWHEPVVVIGTTHSPWLLEECVDAEEVRAYVLTRHADDGLTRAYDVSQIPGIGKQREARGLAFLFATNWIEHQLPL